MTRALAATAALAAALACAAPPDAPRPQAIDAAASAAVRRFPAFPERVVSGNVAVEAAFVLDHAAFFGGDLPSDADVLPIALTLLSSSVTPAVPLASLRLVLPDGSSLAAVDPASIRTTIDKVSDRARAHALSGRAQAPLGDSYVYFALEPRGDLHLSGAELRRRAGLLVRSLELSRALLVFQLHGDGPAREVRVGIGLAERT